MSTVQTARVLVADVDNGIRLTVSEILASCGFRVIEARDGEEALGKLASGEVDAVVLDVKMPGRDGISVVEHLIPDPPPPGILLVTAYDLGQETHARLGSRVHKILRKPVPPLALINAVREAVEVARRARMT